MDDKGHAMTVLWVTMKWSDKCWHPLCGPVELDEAEALLTDKMTMIFPASSDAIHLAKYGTKGNEDD